MTETAIDYDTIRALQDRTDIEEVLYKYSSAVDSFDKAGVRSCLADDIHAHSSSESDKPPLTPSMLNVNEQLERIVEVAIVLLVGAMISTGYWSVKGIVLAALLFGAIRPLAVWVGIGAAGAAVLGILLFGESASPPRLLFLALLVIAIIGLKFTTPV